MKHIANFRFSEEDVAMCKEQFGPDQQEEQGFFEWLRNVDCSSIVIHSFKEGSVCFPNEPLVTVEVSDLSISFVVSAQTSKRSRSDKIQCDHGNVTPKGTSCCLPVDRDDSFESHQLFDARGHKRDAHETCSRTQQGVGRTWTAQGSRSRSFSLSRVSVFDQDPNND